MGMLRAEGLGVEHYAGEQIIAKSAGVTCQAPQQEEATKVVINIGA